MTIGYAGALLGGALSLLSPCSVLLLPAFFAYAFTSPARLIGRTALFYAGLTATLVPMGLLAGVVGSFVTEHRSVIVAVAAAIVIVIGVVQIAGVPIPGFTRGSGTEGTSAVSVFVLGTVYAVAGVCTGPILGSVLTVAAMGGSPVYGGILLALYALGMTVPLLILSLLWTRLRIAERGWLRPREIRVGRWRNTWWMVASGLLSIAIGIVLIVTEGTTNLPSLLTVDQQYRAETWVIDASMSVPNLAVGAIAVIALIAIALLYRRRARTTRNRAVADSRAGEGSS